jgi:CheY-like chemotaxis protein
MEKTLIVDPGNMKVDTINITNFNFSIAKMLGNDKKFTVLVIDDHKLVRDNTKNLIKGALVTLKLEDYDILEGNDGIDLLNFVRLDHEGKIKIIFTDENMEYINGSEAIKIMRKLEENKKMKNYTIASISAFDDIVTKKRILDSGANLVISKPTYKSEILKAVQNAVSEIEH